MKYDIEAKLTTEEKAYLYNLTPKTMESWEDEAYKDGLMIINWDRYRKSRIKTAFLVMVIAIGYFLIGLAVGGFL